MVDIVKPVYGEAWASSGEKLSPTKIKVQSGWVQEMMPYQWENFLQNRQDTTLLYLLQKGVPEWSVDQEYIGNKSIVTYNGYTYQAKSTNTGNLPTDSVYWKRTSPNVTDSGIVTLGSGGTGATNATDARTNLGLGTAATVSADTIVFKSVTGNAPAADKWTSPISLSLSGGATGNTSLDGSGNATINVSGLNASSISSGTVPSTALSNATLKTSSTGSTVLAAGFTSERDLSPAEGYVRWNKTTKVVEVFNGTSWIVNTSQPETYPLNRANHTGEQPIATVTGLPVVLPSLVKAEYSLPCIIKTSATTLAIKAGTHVKIGNAYVSFTAQTAVSMPAVLTPGEDYAVFVHPDGAASSVADPFSAPAAAPAPGALKIGGFHYGLVAPGTTPASGRFATTGFTNAGGNYPWTQARVDRIAGINEFSIWDLSFMSKGEQRGFAFDPQTRVWSAVYFCGPDHSTSGISRYNTAVASGTVLPKIPVEYGDDGTTTYGRLSAYEALEILASHGCRLMTQEEFASGALGVTEGQSLGGAASTIPATKREPGYTSRIGLEQATGHIWTIGGPLTCVSATTWTVGANRGNCYGGAGLPLFGGDRSNTDRSGSRASAWSGVFWNSGWNQGLRAACDHYQGGY